MRPSYVVLCAAIVFAQPVQSHNQRLRSATAPDIVPGGTQVYRVQARAGDLVAGTIDPPTTPLSVELYTTSAMRNLASSTFPPRVASDSSPPLRGHTAYRCLSQERRMFRTRSS